MWSYCALIVGHDGIDSPIRMACPATRHKPSLRHVPPEGESRHPSGVQKNAAANWTDMGFAAVARSAFQYLFRILC